MIYIGKFINNFKDFYNDINSATLTGAIDVIVVRQPDGSYVCSPFHVRFGKIGVLRSREKVVDIEVNGVPVDIHMKLGESGEAFFVEEVSPEKEIPYYLATSPIPDAPDIQFELDKLKALPNNSNFNLLPLQVPEKFTKAVQKSLEQSQLQQGLSSLSIKPTTTDCDIVNSDSTSTKPKADATKCHTKNSNNSPEEVANHTDSSDEYKTKRKRKKKVSSKKRNKAKDAKNTVKPITNDSELVNDEPEEIFQMDDDFREDADEGFGGSGLSRSISLPIQANINTLYGREWAHRKMSSTFTGEFHPFSDGDVTPHTSPVHSRPPSPKSDTEYENQKIESGSPDENIPSWGWGQLPNVPINLNDEATAMDGTGIALDEKDKDTASEAEKRSMLGGMLNFMRSTKKIRHMPESEGIYLSELNSDELDPELAALYFPKFKSSYSQPCPVKDEDTESGKGPSLPHSPHTVEGGSITSQDSDSDERLSLDQFSKEKCESISYPYSDLAMSLCGGLTDPETDLPEDRFLHSVITFDEFTENPGLLYDPNLVIRIGGKFYNWQTAASMLTSIIMYQRPLPEKTANQLILDHMPKKKKKSYSSWWSWRRSEAEEKAEIDISSSQMTPNGETPQEEATSLTDSGEATPKEAEEQMNTVVLEASDSVVIPIEEVVEETVHSIAEVVTVVEDELHIEPEPDELEEVVVESDEPNEISVTSSDSTPASTSPINIASSPKLTEEILELSPPTPETVAHIPTLSAKDEDNSNEDDKPSKEKYKKSLRLNSKQIDNLNLKEGPNEFVFSVTTAYQGTTKCTCQVFLWNYNDKIVISDIDGTITKSDVLGHILPIMGHSWAQLGVAKLFTKIHSNGYRFLYLSARAIGQARITRDYLRTVRQGEICLPDGPLLLSPTSLISALHREVIERKPEEFKISCLKDIQTLFPSYMGNPFYAGFGNKINDQWAYRAVGIPLTRSFTINHRGELKLELIQTFQSSYTRLSDDVDHVFPPLQPTVKVIFSSPEEFSYFTYWREPVLSLKDEELLA